MGGLNGYRLGLYEKSMPEELSLREKRLAAKAAGYDFIELSIDESDEKIARLDWPDQEILNFHQENLETGIGFESICFSAQRRYPLGSLREGAAEQAVELFRKAVDFAMKTGIRIIQAQGYDCYYGEESSLRTGEQFFHNLKACVQYAAAYGVTIGFETMENDFMNTVNKAMYYVEQLGSPYLQVYPDVGNIYNGAADVRRDLEAGKYHLCAVHLKETMPGKFREIPYGTGQVDFETVLRITGRLGVNRYVAEFWHTGEPDYRTALADNSRFLRTCLDRVYQKGDLA